MMSELYLYQPESAVDLLLAQTWARMNADNDLDKLFSDSQMPLSVFMRAVGPPHETYYSFDDEGITFLVWFESFMSGTFLSAYFRPDQRGVPETYRLFRAVLRGAVHSYGTVLNVTWQTGLLAIHKMMGYEVVGTIPGLFRGRDALVFSCNRVSMDLAEERALTLSPSAFVGRERVWLDMLAQQEERKLNGISRSVVR